MLRGVLWFYGLPTFTQLLSYLAPPCLNPVFIRNVLSRTVFYKALPITQDKFSLLTLILDNKAV